MKVKCQECGKTFEKDDPKRAKAALAMHIGRVHGNIRMPKGMMQKKRAAQAALLEPTEVAPKFVATTSDPGERKQQYNAWYRARQKQLASHPANEKGLRGETLDETPRERAARLARERRRGLRTPRKYQNRNSNSTPVEIHFCPRCGFSMDVLATALAVVKRT